MVQQQEGKTMELTRKLNMFYTSAIEVANQQSHADMEEFTASMEKLMEEFKNQKTEELDSRYRIEEEKLKREENRKISEEATEQKRRLNLHQQEKKQALFARVKEKLSAFRETKDYDAWLVSKIRMAKKFARREEITIYINPDDAGKKEWLEQETGCVLSISEIEFGGGIRAVVRSKNVLIDESVETRLRQEWDAYTF